MNIARLAIPFALALSLSVPAARADVLRVDTLPGADFRDLRTAWEQAGPDDVLLLGPGEHDLGGVALAAPAGPVHRVLVGAATGTVVRGLGFARLPAGSSVAVRGLTVHGLTLGSPGPGSLAAAGGPFFVFEDSDLFGIAAFASDASFSRCLLRGTVDEPGPFCGPFCPNFANPALLLNDTVAALYDCTAIGSAIADGTTSGGTVAGVGVELQGSAVLVAVNSRIEGGSTPAFGGSTILGGSGVLLGPLGELALRGTEVVGGDDTSSTPPEAIDDQGGAVTLLPEQPSAHVVTPGAAKPGDPVLFSAAADAGELVLVAVSQAPTSSAQIAFFGLPTQDLALSTLYVLGPAGPTGGIAVTTRAPQIPAGVPGLTLYTQGVSIDPLNGAFVGATSFLTVAP